MTAIIDIQGRQIIDSRGNPTIEVDVTLKSGAFGRASVPSGASTGLHEAVELRDGDDLFFAGKGVLKACENVNSEIFETIVGMDSEDQLTIDNTLIKLDGTENKSRLGANATLGVSLAVARASAEEAKLPVYRYMGGTHSNLLPVPMMNIINGGEHADNGIDFQEFMIMPVGAESCTHAIRIGAEIFHCLKRSLEDACLNTNVGDEGGFAPNISATEEALGFIMKAIEVAGYEPGEDVFLALDAASSEFYNEGSYILKGENKTLNYEEMVAYYENLISLYPIISIEDGLSEDDWDGWKYMTQKIGQNCQLVGDDLFVTNVKRLENGIKNAVANSILIKVNQIGTLSESFEAVEMAHKANYTTVISHRSGETEDTTVADIAVAVNSGQIKTGSLSRSDRLAKYNQLIRIEEKLGLAGKYAGRSILP